MRLHHRGRAAVTAALLALALGAPAYGMSATAAPPPTPSTATQDEAIVQYEIQGPSTAAERTALLSSGVSIDEVDARSVVVSADPAQAKDLRARGYRLTALPGPPDRNERGAAAKPMDFPSADSTTTTTQRRTRRSTSASPSTPGS